VAGSGGGGAAVLSSAILGSSIGGLLVVKGNTGISVVFGGVELRAFVEGANDVATVIGSGAGATAAGV